MMYKENPKTKGSGIIACIPQKNLCPNNCPDCFFQSGRSYLEPLSDNLPNMPGGVQAEGRVVRVNDGNDSSNEFETVLNKTRQYKWKFYNTIKPDNLKRFKAPVVLTVNPGAMTDTSFHKIEDPPDNLMFVRFRTNTWNLSLLDEAVEWYSERNIPIILTFMAYHKADSIPPLSAGSYSYRDRTVNKYYAINAKIYRMIMAVYTDNKFVYSCGREGIASECRFCGNCLREFFATKERMR